MAELLQHAEAEAPVCSNQPVLPTQPESIANTDQHHQEPGPSHRIEFEEPARLNQDDSLIPMPWINGNEMGHADALEDDGDTYTELFEPAEDKFDPLSLLTTEEADINLTFWNILQGLKNDLEM